MNRYALQLFLIIVMAMMSTASGEEKVKIIVYEEFSKLGDPYADGDDKADFDLKKIEELIVSDQYLALFFQGVFEEEIKEKGLTHPFIGKPIYLEIQVGDKKNASVEDLEELYMLFFLILIPYLFRQEMTVFYIISNLIQVERTI